MRRLIILLGLLAPLGAFAGEPRSEVLGRAELPPKVESAFERQAGEQGLERIRRSVDARGHAVYAAEIAGTGRTVEVASDGTVLTPNR